MTVIATDPSGATGMATVNIVVTDADEAPVLADTNATEASLGEDGDDEPILNPEITALPRLCPPVRI